MKEIDITFGDYYFRIYNLFIVFIILFLLFLIYHLFKKKLKRK